MRKKKLNKKIVIIFLVVLLFSFMVTKSVTYYLAEKINPYEKIELRGSQDCFIYEKHGNRYFVTVFNLWMGTDEKEKEIPGFVYYAVALYLGSMGIEDFEGKKPNGCVDGYICYIMLDQKDGTRIFHYTYEYDFPQREKVDRLYKFLGAAEEKRLIRHMCTEISHTKTYREIRYKVQKETRDFKNIFAD